VHWTCSKANLSNRKFFEPKFVIWKELLRGSGNPEFDESHSEKMLRFDQELAPNGWLVQWQIWTTLTFFGQILKVRTNLCMELKTPWIRGIAHTTDGSIWPHIGAKVCNPRLCQRQLSSFERFWFLWAICEILHQLLQGALIAEFTRAHKIT